MRSAGAALGALVALTACGAASTEQVGSAASSSAAARSEQLPGAGQSDRTPSTAAATSSDPVATDSAPTPLQGGAAATSSRSDLVVVTTYAGWSADTAAVEVGGYVEGLVESGGECELTLTRNGRSVEGRGEAFPDAATTSCEGIVVPGGSLGPGTWEAVLRYSSSAYSGQSTPFSVDVP